MSIDFSKTQADRKEPAFIDPTDLFQRLKISDKSINDLWLAQDKAQFWSLVLECA